MKDIFNKVTEKVSDAKNSVLDSFSLESLSEKFTGMTDAAKEKATTFTNELISLAPILEEMGFKTTGISITMGLPPDVTFHFIKGDDVSPERRRELLELHKDKAMLGTITKMLVTTDEYQDKLKLGSFHFSTIDLCIGLTPGVTIQLTPKG